MDKARKPGRQQRVNIEIPQDMEAVYANLAVISHTPSEIVLDFARVLPNSPKGKVYSRVVMTPMNAKSLLQALSTNLAKFEEQYGEIRTPADKQDDREVGFRHN